MDASLPLLFACVQTNTSKPASVRIVDALREKYGIDLIVPSSPGTFISSVPSVTVDEEQDMIWLCGPAGGSHQKVRIDASMITRLTEEIHHFVQRMGDWTSVELKIDPKFHARLIGSQGKGLIDLQRHVAIQKGDMSTYEDGETTHFSVHFPRIGEKEMKVKDLGRIDDPQKVVVRGDKKDVELAVEKLKELVEELRHHEVAKNILFWFFNCFAFVGFILCR